MNNAIVPLVVGGIGAVIGLAALYFVVRWAVFGALRDAELWKNDGSYGRALEERKRALDSGRRLPR